LEENLNNDDSIVSTGSSKLGGKALIMVNFSKLIVEFVGTTTIAVIYLLLGDQQAGMLLGFWVVTLFGIGISGGHFNPSITLV